MTRTVVHLLRHGEVHNPGGVLYGRLPGFLLSKVGEQMALAAAEALAHHQISYVVTSPLERAQQTAQPFAEHFGLEVHTDPRLQEALNVFEGRRFAGADGVLRRPSMWPKLRNPFTPSWGEPYQQIVARMYAAMLAARDAALGNEAVCVSHQLPIWIVRRHIERRPLWHHPAHRQCGLASLTSFTFDDDQITDVGYREPAAHLVTATIGRKVAGA